MIGGTRFVGRHIVDASLAAGHDVTVFHRGQNGPELFPQIERRMGDRNGDLAELAEDSWDATVDTCAYPRWAGCASRRSRTSQARTRTAKQTCSPAGTPADRCQGFV